MKHPGFENYVTLYNLNLKVTLHALNFTLKYIKQMALLI